MTGMEDIQKRAKNRAKSKNERSTYRTKKVRYDGSEKKKEYDR